MEKYDDEVTHLPPQSHVPILFTLELIHHHFRFGLLIENFSIGIV